MRLDHVAYRVADRAKTAEFFQKAFGYRLQTEFELDFGAEGTVKCLALSPPEKSDLPSNLLRWTTHEVIYEDKSTFIQEHLQEYHLAPEIFVSDGKPETVVGKWVAARGGIGGIHHLAYQVKDVAAVVKEWREKGYSEFTSEMPFECPGLVQIFTKPSLLTGVIIEFIKREEFGFCAGNVKNLMTSTGEADVKMG